MNPLAGLSLFYGIGADEQPAGSQDRIIEVAFGQPPVKGGPSIAYGNFLDQREDRVCGPYLTAKGTAAQYSEGVPDPAHDGFLKNLRLQFELARSQGHRYVEIDNPDDEHFTIADTIRGIELAATYDLGVIAKNPGLLNGGTNEYVSHPNVYGIIVEAGAGNADELDEIRRQAGKSDLPVWFVYFGDGREFAQRRKAEIVARNYRNMSVTFDSADEEYGGDVEDILLPIAAPNQSVPMAYSLTWLPDVLRAAGLKVVETEGWQTRGHGDMGKVQGVLCHHTNGAATGNMPTLPVLIDGRSDLPGPLSQLGLGRDGTYYVVCAGKGWHAGSGGWKGITDGNSHLIGIEAENVGTGSDPWPDVQMDAYRRGVAAILQHVGATADYAIGHKEWTPRKDDPTFDMNQFRRDVATLMAGGTIKPLPDTPENRPVLGKGDTGAWVEKLQKLVGVKVDGDFGPDTDAAVRAYQATRGLKVDGLVGRDTWAALMANAPAVQPAPTASGKASWYGQYDGKYRWRDSGDAPNSNALGVPDDAQGVSFPQENGTIGQWFAITGPEGITTIEQQTEHGPAAWTGKAIDIHAACAERHGYSPHNITNSPNPFPTPSIWSWRKISAPAAVAGLSPQQQAVKWRDLRKTNPQPDPAPIPQPEPQPMPDAAIAQIMSALTKIDARLTRLEQAPVPVPAGGTDWVRIISSVGSTMEKLPHAVEAVDGVLERLPQIISAAERIANLAERIGPLLGLLGGRALSAASPMLIQAPAAPTPPPAPPAPSSGPGVGFWPGLLTVIGSAIAALNGVDPHIAASVAAPGVGLMGAAAVKATPKDWTAVRASIAPKT